MREVSKTKRQVPGIVTTASSTMQPVCLGSITIFGSDDDVRRWRHVGAEQGLTDDLNIAVFLITFYEKHKDAVTSATYSWCKASLSLTCATNSHSSQFRGNGSALQ
ncbi:hypothetical protein V1264_015323 [Littorina saxatilis]|uniref:Uncharacterized protein n=1 Tax=Littorina saxatilis TaxID=31220 RepID=A0AAN9BL65_9CAEN